MINKTKASRQRPDRDSQDRDTIRYDTRCYFNVRSKADISQLNLPHGDQDQDRNIGLETTDVLDDNTFEANASAFRGQWGGYG